MPFLYAVLSFLNKERKNFEKTSPQKIVQSVGMTSDRCLIKEKKCGKKNRPGRERNFAYVDSSR